MYLKTPQGSTKLGRDQAPVSTKLSNEAFYCFHGIKIQSFIWLKLESEVQFLIPCATILSFCSLRVIFSYWGAEELCFLWEKKKVFTFGGKATPQLDLPWPGYQRHPCESFSLHSFFHSLIPDTSPKPLTFLLNCIHHFVC